MKIPDVFQPLTQFIENGDDVSAAAEALRLAEAGNSVVDIFQQAIVPCMTNIGNRFSNFELFLPEMIYAADAVKAIHAALSETLKRDGGEIKSAGKVVIGSVYGDMHDIGKNIVATMLEVNGFEIHDVGVDVTIQDFIKRAREVDADVIALSCLMTTSIPYMEDVIKLVKEGEKDRDRFKILVGGGPVTPDVAAQIGANAYGRDAADAVVQMHALLK